MLSTTTKRILLSEKQNKKVNCYKKKKKKVDIKEGHHWELETTHPPPTRKKWKGNPSYPLKCKEAQPIVYVNSVCKVKSFNKKLNLSTIHWELHLKHLTSPCHNEVSNPSKKISQRTWLITSILRDEIMEIMAKTCYQHYI